MSMSAEERKTALVKMQLASGAFYRAAVSIGNHPFIEFAGLMNEYHGACREADDLGIDFSECSKHTGLELPLYPFQIDYINEKLECIFGGRIAIGAEPDVREAPDPGPPIKAQYAAKSKIPFANPDQHPGPSVYELMDLAIAVAREEGGEAMAAAVRVLSYQSVGLHGGDHLEREWTELERLRSASNFKQLAANYQRKLMLTEMERVVSPAIGLIMANRVALEAVMAWADHPRSGEQSCLARMRPAARGILQGAA